MGSVREFAGGCLGWWGGTSSCVEGVVCKCYCWVVACGAVEGILLTLASSPLLLKCNGFCSTKPAIWYCYESSSVGVVGVLRDGLGMEGGMVVVVRLGNHKGAMSMHLTRKTGLRHPTAYGDSRENEL